MALNTNRIENRPQLAGPTRVLVIGAGVAGSTAAIRMAHHGCDVTLAERANFPREKICGCCLGAAGLQALDAIGLSDGVRNLGIATHTFTACLPPSSAAESLPMDLQQQRGNAGDWMVRLPIMPGVAISRSVLDAYLIQQARLAGVHVVQPCDAQVVRTDGERTQVRTRSLASNSTSSGAADWQADDTFELVVLATGLSGVYSGGSDTSGAQGRWQLPWIVPPHGPLGIATHLPADHPLAQQWVLPNGEIQMVCNDDGYVGLVRLPGGDIDMAAALRSRKQVGRQPNERMSEGNLDSTRSHLASLLSLHPGFPFGAIDELQQWFISDAVFMTAPPLRRKRQAGEGRVVAIGDFAGYVEPMTGEGMTWGIESGLAVADLWMDQGARADFASQWAAKQRMLQRKRRWMCSGVTRAMRWPMLRQATRFTLSLAPWLARPITRGLARGPRFPKTYPAQ